MIKIEIDSVVKEYVIRIMGSVLFGNNGLLVGATEPDERLKEKIFISILQSAVVSGAAMHRYRSEDGVDEFLCTDRLIRNWAWVFSGSILTANRVDRETTEVSGRRSKYFGKTSFRTDKDNPPPNWPD
jgi:hypothetical protein